MSEIAIVTVILLISIILLVTEKLQVDLVAIGIIIALLNFGILDPREALSGFSNPAPITVAVLFILSRGLVRTGALDVVTRKIITLTRGRKSLLLLLLLLVAGFFSAFLNNTPVVVLCISIIMVVCAKYSLVPSKYLIPVSFISILAGTCTLIGTSTNIIVSDLGVQNGFEPIGMFELSVIGVPLAFAGTIFLYFFSFRLLPAHKTPIYGSANKKEGHYISELLIPSDSPLIGLDAAKEFRDRYPDIEVYEVITGSHVCDPATNTCMIGGSDIILVKTTANKLAQILEDGVVALPKGEEGTIAKPYDKKSVIVEFLIPPNSNFIGRRLATTTVGVDPHIHIIGVKRRQVHYALQKLKSIRLTVGDILLVQCPVDHLEQFRDNSDVIVMEDIVHSIINRKKAPLAAGFFLAMIIAATLGFLNIMNAAITAAFLMIITNCINLREAYRSIEVNVVILIIGTIALGLALQKTGAADLYAQGYLTLFRGYSPAVVLSAFIFLTSLLSHFLSNNSTAVLIMPIAISTAATLGVDPRPFIIGICFGSSACFASPIGYQTNLLVYSAGGYRFTDFLKLGLPLNLLVCGTTSLLIPVFWPFHP